MQDYLAYIDGGCKLTKQKAAGVLAGLAGPVVTSLEEFCPKAEIALYFLFKAMTHKDFREDRTHLMGKRKKTVRH